eukprot:scaffold17160_cov158-Skeletonema_marinoi.AAC.4
MQVDNQSNSPLKIPTATECGLRSVVMTSHPMLARDRAAPRHGRMCAAALLAVTNRWFRIVLISMILATACGELI